MSNVKQAAKLLLLLIALSTPARADEPLQFSGGRVYSTDTHSAVIEWQTNLPTNGRIDYGEEIKSASRVSLVIDFDTLHRTLLFGLIEG